LRSSKGSYVSRNLCTDTCQCGDHRFTLGEFRDKPVEFRQYGDYSPLMGAKLICPKCERVYFAWVTYRDKFWSDPSDAFAEYLDYPNGQRVRNKNQGKFVRRAFTAAGGEPRWEDTGYYRIDLSYYETYNDEGVGEDTDKPRHLWDQGDDVWHCRWAYD